MPVNRLLTAVMLAVIVPLGACGSGEKPSRLSNAECGRALDGHLTAGGTIYNLRKTGSHNRNYELHVKWLSVDDAVMAETLADVHGVPEGASRAYTAVSIDTSEAEPARCEVSVRTDCAASAAERGTCGRLNTGRPPPSL